MAVNTTFAIGKYDGYRAQRPVDDDYEMLLNDARDLPVILYDTTQREAVQTNAEDLILQVLLHKQDSQNKSQYDKISNTSKHSRQQPNRQEITGAVADKSIRSARQTMINNAERVIANRIQLQSPGEKEILFKHEVDRLYNVLDGVRGQIISQGSSSQSMKIHLGLHRGKRRLLGWEYLALVDYSTHQGLKPKCVYLDSSSGPWTEYAQDIQALVFFGSNFGNPVQPLHPETFCAECQTASKGRDCLTVKVETLEALFEQQGCSEDRLRLTDEGWTIQSMVDPFVKCDDTTTGASQARGCGKVRVVRLIKKAPRDKSHFIHKLPKGGAIVIGEPGKNTLKKDAPYEYTKPESVSPSCQMEHHEQRVEGVERASQVPERCVRTKVGGEHSVTIRLPPSAVAAQPSSSTAAPTSSTVRHLRAATTS